MENLKWNTPTYFCSGCLATIAQKLPSTTELLLGTTNNHGQAYCPDCNRKILKSKTTGGV